MPAAHTWKHRIKNECRNVPYTQYEYNKQYGYNSSTFAPMLIHPWPSPLTSEEIPVSPYRTDRNDLLVCKNWCDQWHLAPESFTRKKKNIRHGLCRRKVNFPVLIQIYFSPPKGTCKLQLSMQYQLADALRCPTEGGTFDAQENNGSRHTRPNFKGNTYRSLFSYLALLDHTSLCYHFSYTKLTC